MLNGRKTIIMSEIAHIDCGYLATVQAMLAELWTDPITNIDLVAHAETARAVLENQSVNLGELQSKDKKRVVSLEWLTDCDADTDECSDDCTIDGSDSTPVCKEYEVVCLQESSFKVGDRAYRERTISSEKSIAFLLGKRMKLLMNGSLSIFLPSLLLMLGRTLILADREPSQED